jgi:hypothetical protein
VVGGQQETRKGAQFEVHERLGDLRQPGIVRPRKACIGLF